MKDVALLIERVAFGGLMAGHGAQKLFGSFGGGGLSGTEGFMKIMNMKPARQWAILAGLSEFAGGSLTALGALNPIGPISTIGAMSMATAKAHWNKPVWNTKGGAELPVLNIAAVLSMALTGPGKYSLDNALGIKLPRRLLLIPGLAVVAASVVYAVISSNQPHSEEQPTQQEQITKQAQPKQTEEEAVPVPISPDNDPQTDSITGESEAEYHNDQIQAEEPQSHPS
ncbi:MAG: DoxX family protein [Chloroflexia bacterium]